LFVSSCLLPSCPYLCTVPSSEVDKPAFSNTVHLAPSPESGATPDEATLLGGRLFRFGPIRRRRERNRGVDEEGARYEDAIGNRMNPGCMLDEGEKRKTVCSNQQFAAKFGETMNCPPDPRGEGRWQQPQHGDIPNGKRPFRAPHQG
jgi:hypothetical protein